MRGLKPIPVILQTQKCPMGNIHGRSNRCDIEVITKEATVPRRRGKSVSLLDGSQVNNGISGLTRGFKEEFPRLIHSVACGIEILGHWTN